MPRVRELAAEDIQDPEAREIYHRFARDYGPFLNQVKVFAHRPPALKHIMGLLLDLADEVVDTIASRCTEAETGARNVDHLINATLLPQISTELLQRMAQGPLPPRLDVGVQDGEFTVVFQD